MPVMISYDLNDKHEEFKEKLISMGYLDRFELEGKSCHLPETTLMKADSKSATAKADMIILARVLGITLERAVAVDISGFDVIHGRPVGK